MLRQGVEGPCACMSCMHLRAWWCDHANASKPLGTQFELRPPARSRSEPSHNVCKSNLILSVEVAGPWQALHWCSVLALHHAQSELGLHIPLEQLLFRSSY